MVITKQLTGKSLKVLNNYGTVDRKVVTKVNTYSQILPTALLLHHPPQKGPAPCLL